MTTQSTDPPDEKRITKRDTSWESMYEALIQFQSEQGHCNVPLNHDANQALGRWVATQRFRKKINALSPDRVQRLNEIGFVWSIADVGWERMFDELRRVKKRLGHCNIPAKWSENMKLASWVTNQRHKRKKGLMSPERVRRLDEIGFFWSARPCQPATEKELPPPAQPVAAAADQDFEPEVASEEEYVGDKLYNLGPGVYVQHNDHNPMPPELLAYIDEHGGESPPYIPLPASRVEFMMGNPFLAKRRKIVWSGHGPLDPEILEFVHENGVLPVWE